MNCPVGNYRDRDLEDKVTHQIPLHREVCCGTIPRLKNNPQKITPPILEPFQNRKGSKKKKETNKTSPSTLSLLDTRNTSFPTILFPNLSNESQLRREHRTRGGGLEE
ncbi:hypothetical protein CEXT_720921 [Caerostris extrusa]|uniref:Uncharacterized protein n=1 Tax=Caerostris extrusa TaxID=172846 RepID=A0AAV4M7L0_CAEEX|nr:hypothetical protein CEXT_720921 [Caerostris extrusa]